MTTRLAAPGRSSLALDPSIEGARLDVLPLLGGHERLEHLLVDVREGAFLHPKELSTHGGRGGFVTVDKALDQLVSSLTVGERLPPVVIESQGRGYVREGVPPG